MTELEEAIEECEKAYAEYVRLSADAMKAKSTWKKAEKIADEIYLLSLNGEEKEGRE